MYLLKGKYSPVLQARSQGGGGYWGHVPPPLPSRAKPVFPFFPVKSGLVPPLGGGVAGRAQYQKAPLG